MRVSCWFLCGKIGQYFWRRVYVCNVYIYDIYVYTLYKQLYRLSIFYRAEGKCVYVYVNIIYIYVVVVICVWENKRVSEEVTEWLGEWLSEWRCYDNTMYNVEFHLFQWYIYIYMWHIHVIFIDNGHEASPNHPWFKCFRHFKCRSSKQC